MRVIGDYIPVSVVKSLFKNFEASGGPQPIFELLEAVERLQVKPQYVHFSGDVRLPEDLPIVDKDYYLNPMMHITWGGPGEETMRVMLENFEVVDGSQKPTIFQVVCNVIFVCPEITTLAKETEEFGEKDGYSVAQEIGTGRRVVVPMPYWETTGDAAYFPKGVIKFREVPRWKDNTFEVVEKPDVVEKGENIDFSFGYAESRSCSRVWLNGKGLKSLAAWLKEHVPATNIFLNGEFYWEGHDHVDRKYIILTDRDRAERAAFQKKVQPYKDAVIPYIQRKGLSLKSMGADSIFGAVETLYKKGVTNPTLNALLSIAIGECGSLAFAMMMMPAVARAGESEEYFRSKEENFVRDMISNYDIIRPRAGLKPNLIQRISAPLKKETLPEAPSKEVTLAFAHKMFELYGKKGDLTALNRAYEEGDLSAVAVTA